VLFVVICWYAVNLWGIGQAVNHVLPRNAEWRRQLLALVALAGASYRAASGCRGWREHVGRFGIANAGMMQGLLAALIVTTSSRAFEEGFAYNLPTFGFGYPLALLVIAYRTVGETFSLWEFVELAAASGAGMLGGMQAARRRRDPVLHAGSLQEEG
jgi:hypothetical protein